VSRSAPRVPAEVHDEAARRRAEPESARAVILLGSDRPPLAKLMCRGRHRLGAVYSVAGRRILAVPERVMLSVSLYREVIDDTQETILTAWSWDVDTHEGTGWIPLRCRCGTWATDAPDVRRQLDHSTRKRGGWILVSRSYPANSPPERRAPE